MNALLIAASLLAPTAEPPSKETPKAVAATRTEFKDQLEAYKKATPRIPMPPADPNNPQARVNNGWFRSYYLADLSDNSNRAASGNAGTRTPGGRDPDPAMTLDNTFKVKLFWIASRANNCLY
jgi:hypothetical protein